jgi:SAM-dependent methyltransferase
MEPSAVSHRRLLGPSVTFVKRLIRKAIRWYVGPQFLHLEDRVRELPNLEAQVRQEVAHLHSHLAKLEAERANTQAELLGQFVELRAENESHCSAQVQHLTGLVHDLVDRCEAMQGALRAEHQRVSLFLRVATKTVPQPLAERLLPLQAADHRHDLDQLYSSFEDRFRGSRDEIKNRQAVYLPLLTQHGLGTEEMPVLDLGCGRGEWLELLHDAGLHGRGVDTNRHFLDQCRRLDLSVLEADLLEYLRATPEGSVGVVTGFHVIEHLPFPQQLELLDESLRVLRPGGLALFETPNPENIVVGSCNFYADPTHHHPLFPPTLQFLAQARGFVRTEIRRVNQQVLESQFCEGETPTPQWQRLFEYVKHHFLVAPDYAVIGWKA